MNQCSLEVLKNKHKLSTNSCLLPEFLFVLTLKTPIPTKVVCFSRLLKCLRNLYGKQCGPRSDCSYRSSLFWVHTVCFYTYFVSNARQSFAADDFSRGHFQMHFFLGALRIKTVKMTKSSKFKLEIIFLEHCAPYQMLAHMSLIFFGGHNSGSISGILKSIKHSSHHIFSAHQVLRL